MHVQNRKGGKAMSSHRLFSNGTEYMSWIERNCDRCVKAVFPNEKTDKLPKYRCAVQRNVDMALFTDGCGDRHTYDAVKCSVCPYLKTERNTYKKKERIDENQLKLF